MGDEMGEQILRYYAPGEVAGWVGVTSTTIIRWCDAGQLQAITTPGGHRRIPSESLIAFFAMKGLKLPKTLAPAAPSAPKRILVVDEGKQLRRLTNRLKKHAEITATTNTRWAKTLASEIAPTVIVVSLTPLFGAGKRLVNELKANEPTKKIPVFVFFERPEQINDWVQMGANRYFEWAEFSKLDEQVRVVLAQS